MKDKKESADFKPYVTFLTGRSKQNFCLSNNKTQLSYIQEIFLLISFLGSKALVISVEGMVLTKPLDKIQSTQIRLMLQTQVSKNIKTVKKRFFGKQPKLNFQDY